VGMGKNGADGVGMETETFTVSFSSEQHPT